jgi:membrane protein
MFLVLLGVLAFLLAVLAVVIGPMIWKLAVPVLDIALTWKWLWDGARYLLAVFVLLAVVTVLYHWLPDTRPRWSHILPGALLASLGWLLLASLFSIFLDRVEIFTVFYGSLGSIIVTLLFLFFSAADFILGAEFNAALRDRQVGV